MTLTLKYLFNVPIFEDIADVECLKFDIFQSKWVILVCFNIKEYL